jgi:putative redox protein
MAIDVVQILTKAHQRLEAVRVTLVGERRSEDPKFFTRRDLHFIVTGEIASVAAERALCLPQEKYCSACHSLRRDIGFRTTSEIAKDALS